MRRNLFLLQLFALLFSVLSCKKDIQTFSINRESLVTFQNSQLVSLSARENRFYGGATVIYTYPDNSQQALYKFVLQSDGTDDMGRRFNLQFEVDVVQNGNYVGIYRPKYDPAIGGLADFRYTVQQGNQFIVYGLAPGNMEAFVQVQAQSNEEKIVRGIFAATLVNRSDTTAANMEVNNGIFIDISF